MNTFTTTYLLAVLFGVSTLVGFALKRFNEHAVNLPPDIVRLELSPRLMTQPERYRVGLAVYIGITLGVYLVVTLFPEAVATLLGGGTFSLPGGDEKVLHGLADGARQASFPLAVAAVLTSAQFLKFAAEPERLIRRFAQRIAGVPEDVGYVVELVRASDWLNPKEVREAAERLGIGTLIVDEQWKSFGDMALVSDNGKPPASGADGRPEDSRGDAQVCPRWQPHAARAIQFADLLQRIRNSQLGVHPNQEERIDYWRHFDFALFGNFWDPAEQRIAALRSALAQAVQAEAMGSKADRSPGDGASASPGAMPAPWEQELHRLQAELSAILAAGVSSGGATHFRDLACILEVFRHGNDVKSEIRRKLIDLRCFGVETRSEVSKWIFVACFVLSIVGASMSYVVSRHDASESLRAVNTWIMKSKLADLFNRQTREKREEFATALGHAAGPDPVYSQICTAPGAPVVASKKVDDDGTAKMLGELCEPVPPMASAPFESGPRLMLVLALGLACAIGFRAAHRRRNEFVAKGLAASRCATHWHHGGVAERAHSGSGKAKSDPPRGPRFALLSIERYLQLLRLGLVAGLIAAVLLQHSFVIVKLTETSEYIDAAQHLVTFCNEELKDASRQVPLALVGADTALMLSIFVVMLALATGALAPAVIVTLAVGSAEFWASHACTDSNFASSEDCEKWRRRRLGCIAFLTVLVVALPLVAVDATDRLAKTLSEQSRDELLIVAKPASRTLPAADANDAGSKITPANANSRGGTGGGTGDPVYARPTYRFLENPNFAPTAAMCSALRRGIGDGPAVRPASFIEFERQSDAPDLSMASKPVKARLQLTGDVTRWGHEAEGAVFFFWNSLQSAIVGLVLFMTMLVGTVLVERRLDGDGQSRGTDAKADASASATAT